ncbi:hypothetical protein BGZ58_006652 [Dissophora ornata]|nr:hypothetical protein BGZ58_006652 [Dissophora ornata]
MKLTPITNQVGGHEGVLSLGDENEIIVKPALPMEFRFYEESVLHPELQAWMPTYYGSLTLTRQQPKQQQIGADGQMGGEAAEPTIKALNGYAITDMLSFDLAGQVQAQEQLLDGVELDKDENDDECLCLENIAHGFTKPCVLDLKLGTQLYDDDASDDKKMRLGAVAANTTSGSLGMRVVGFHVYDSEKGDFIKYSKVYGKALTQDTVLDGFRAYFSAKIGPKRMRLVVERFVNDLTDFLETIKTQEARLRSSSLLMLYEGDSEAFDDALLLEQDAITSVVARARVLSERNDSAKSNGEEEDEEDEEDEYNEEDDDELAQKVTDMRLIDFAHSTWTPGQGPDEGVVLGVKSALLLFERLLEEDYSSEE